MIIVQCTVITSVYSNSQCTVGIIAIKSSALQGNRICFQSCGFPGVRPTTDCVYFGIQLTVVTPIEGPPPLQAVSLPSVTQALMVESKTALKVGFGMNTTLS